MADVDVEVSGEIDTAAADDLKALLYAAIDSKPGESVTVGFSGLEFMDSTGLGVLVAALKHARAAGGDLLLQDLPARAWKLFTITGLDKVFTVSPT